MRPREDRTDRPSFTQEYRVTASLDDSPSCHARSAASAAVSGSDSGAAVTGKAISTQFSLRR